MKKKYRLLRVCLLLVLLTGLSVSVNKQEARAYTYVTLTASQSTVYMTYGDAPAAFTVTISGGTVNSFSYGSNGVAELKYPSGMHQDGDVVNFTFTALKAGTMTTTINAHNSTGTTIGSVKVTVVVAKKAMSVTVADYNGTYDGSGHSISTAVSGSTDYDIYYSAGQALTSANYAEAGSLTAPELTEAGAYTVYYYVADKSGCYEDSSGQGQVNIAPKVYKTAFNGKYNGLPHKATITAAGGATIYYSSEKTLSYSNYAIYGSTTAPTRTDMGTTTVYYIAVADSGTVNSNTCTAGSTTITISKGDMVYELKAGEATCDGNAHTFGLNITAPETCTVYYSTDTVLDASNYADAGSTEKPTRTDSGRTKVYGYIEDNSGNYLDTVFDTVIDVKPKVTVSAYAADYDGEAHGPSIETDSSASLYYSTDTALDYSNYQSAGQLTLPTRTEYGTTTVYYIAIPDNDAADAATCYVKGSTKIEIRKFLTVTAAGYTGTYDGASHTGSLNVQGTDSFTVYYDTTSSADLTEDNYKTLGKTELPCRTLSGTTRVNYYVKPEDDNYFAYSGHWEIRILPRVTAAGYSGTYDGNSHQADVLAEGGATLYYSTVEALTYDNYVSLGLLATPDISSAGTKTVYYIAVPEADPAAETCVCGSVDVILAARNLSDCSAFLDNSSAAYTGSPITPAVTLEYGSAKLVKGRDYTVSYADNTEIGTATVTVTGTGNYTGTKQLEFTIVKAKKEAGLAFQYSSLTKYYSDTAVDDPLSGDTDAPVSYTSSNPDVAEVDDNGSITITGIGKTTITASSPENETYKSGSASYTLTVYKASPELCFDAEQVEKKLGNTAFTNTLSAATDGTLSFYSSNTKVAKVDANGVVTIVGLGTAVISVLAEESDYYTSDMISYKLTVIEKNAAELSFAKTSISKKYGDSAFTNTLSAQTDAAITYSCDNQAVAKVNAATGKVTIVGAGTAVITANAPANDDYKSASVSYTVTVAKAANKITASDQTKVYAAKAQSFSLSAGCLGGAKLTYKSSSAKVKVAANGKVTVAAKFIGTATITITSAQTANYTSVTKRITVSVNPKAPAIKKLSGAKKGTIVTRWSKVSPITKYQIQYSTKKNFPDGNMTSQLRDIAAKYTSLTMSGFPSGTWYVRMRTYRTVGGKKYYSAWSTVKSVKVK